jgi:hypothetical protein
MKKVAACHRCDGSLSRQGCSTSSILGFRAISGILCKFVLEETLGASLGPAALSSTSPLGFFLFFIFVILSIVLSNDI